MPKGKGYGNFEGTFGTQNEHPYDTSSTEKMAEMDVKSNKDDA